MPTLLEELDTIKLSFEQTVPRSLVHKRSLENVLLTEVRSAGADTFICAGRVPTAHRFFNDAARTPQNDILFYTELGRQASLAVSHTFLGISTADVFIFEGSQAVMADEAFRFGFQSSADSVITEINVLSAERRKNNIVNRVVAEHIMSIGGREVFRGTGAWNIQPAALFHRLRRMSARGAQPPSHASDTFENKSGRKASRRDCDNVVISVTELSTSGTAVASLIVDETHPYFFDHPCDHVPGMLLLEGCAQLAMAAVSGSPSVPARTLAIRGYEMNFVQFVECGLPITLTAHVIEDASDTTGLQPPVVHVDISQNGAVSGTATMGVAFLR